MDVRANGEMGEGGAEGRKKKGTEKIEGDRRKEGRKERGKWSWIIIVGFP